MADTKTTSFTHRINSPNIECIDSNIIGEYPASNTDSCEVSVFDGKVAAWVYLSVWFMLNVIITLYSKAVFSVYKFPYPIAMTIIHMMFTSAGVELCALLKLFTPQHLTSQQRQTIFGFSFVFTLNIWLSNASLMMVSVNLHQVVRTTIPLFTMAISWLVFREKYSFTLLPSVIVVIAGVIVTVWGDIDVSKFGLSVVLLGCSLSSLKGILTQKTQVGAYRLSTLNLLRYLCPLASLQLFCLMLLNGELNKISSDANLNLKFILLHICMMGCIAFALNFTSFKSAALNSPLSLNIAGNVKQVLTSLLSVYIFSGVWGSSLFLGVICTALGAFWYSYESQRINTRKKSLEHGVEMECKISL